MIHFPKPTVEQFFRTYTITNFTISADEQKLIFNANLNGKMNLWAMDLPDTYPYQFAQMDESCNFIKIDPDNRYVLAGFDQDGDENYHIYAIPNEGGLPQPLITGEATDKFYYGHLSKDGEQLYYVTSKDNPSYLNTRVRNLNNGDDKLLNVGENFPTYLAAVSENGLATAYLQIQANTYVLSFVKVGEEKFYLTPNQEEVHVVFEPVFTDDQTIYFITDFESDDIYLAKFDLQAKAFSQVVTFDGESIQSLKWDKENNAFYIITSKGVSDFMYRYDIANQTLENRSLPVHIIEQFHIAKSGTLYILGRSATIPHNIYQSKDGVKWKQLTNNRVLGLSKEDLVEPDVVSYTSFDGMKIESLLFKAKPENDNGYTIFWPHGGPQSAERKMFRSMFQCFLNRGYSIFAPNFRGSTGYGSAFTKLVEQDWGEGPRLDCVAGIEWLFEKGISNPEKLFLVGGSYGGYMALLLHGRHSEYFKAVVDIFGVSDLFTFVNSVPEHWKPMMERWVGDPVRDKEKFITDSPITYLEQMVKPMLVIQGAKDPRVVKEESDQIVARLQDLGRDVEYLVLEDEGHGFSKKENEIKVYSMMLEFLEKHQ